MTMTMTMTGGSNSEIDSTVTASQSEGHDNKVVVCVTGASGYVASWLVKFLLLRGYTVHATVRHLSDPNKTHHLRALPGAAHRLHLFQAHLLQQGSFDAAIQGCHAVFHTASPCQATAADPQAELIDPAVKGTLNVLTSCSKYHHTIKRVVLTSSINAVTCSGKPLTSDVLVDETWFSSPDFCKQSELWYHLSKTLAEEAAWKFSKEHAIDMVVINPGFVIGPLLQPTLNATSAIVLNLIDGTKAFPNGLLRSVNVKDVAMAHILAYEIPSANGRYCLVESVKHFSDVVAVIRKLYPSLHLPDKCEDDKPIQSTYQVSKDKARSLGINFIPFETSIKEIMESLKEKGFVTL